VVGWHSDAVRLILGAVMELSMVDVFLLKRRLWSLVYYGISG
jgi:hypothetical protein